MPVCNFCGTVHDGHSPTCPKCGRKVETVADSPVYSFDTAAEEAAEKSRLFALLSFLGVIFMPLSLIFGYMTFKIARSVKEGLYHERIKRMKQVALAAIGLSCIVLVVWLLLYGGGMLDRIADFFRILTTG